MSEASGDKGFVEHWARVGPLLEQIRRQELRQYNYEENRHLIDALLQIAYERRDPQPTSGLVELQRILSRARQS